MKSFFVIVISLLIILTACQPEEPLNLEAFSPQAFAYDLGDVWEVNASVRVKGFRQVKSDETNEFSASVAYSVDLTGPDGEFREGIFKFRKDVSNYERILDISLDSQFELGAQYNEGIYTLTYNINDENSDMETNLNLEFELSK